MSPPTSCCGEALRQARAAQERVLAAWNQFHLAEGMPSGPATRTTEAYATALNALIDAKKSLCTVCAMLLSDELEATEHQGL